MQHYACVNDVPLLGFAPEISSIFIGMHLSPKGSRVVAPVLYQRCRQSSATNFYIFNISRFLASHWHANEFFETEWGKGVSSGASNEEIDGEGIFCWGNKGLLDLVKQQTRNAERNDGNCQYYGHLFAEEMNEYRLQFIPPHDWYFTRMSSSHP